MTAVLIDTGPSGLGWSFSESLLTCPQKWAFTYHPDLQNDPDVLDVKHNDKREPLIKGTLVHTGAAHLYARAQARQVGTDPDAFLAPAEAVAALAEKYDGGSGAWTKWVGLAQETIGLYATTVRQELTHMRVFAVEHREEVTIEGTSFLGTPIKTRHSARFDVVLQDKARRLWAIDHKTTYKIDEKKKRGFSLAGQIVGHYILGRNSWGDSFGGVRVNLMGLMGKSLTTRFQRVAPAPTPGLIAEFRQQVIDRRAIRDALVKSGRDPRRWPKAMSEQGPCMDRYGPCPFRDLCRWGPRS